MWTLWVLCSVIASIGVQGTTWPWPGTTDQPSCRYNCGSDMGSCSCSSSCQYYGNCCYDYNSYCYYTTEQPTSDQPSCRYNCGRHLGSCSCSGSCQYYGNCCYDYNYYCPTTTAPTTTSAGAPCGGYLYSSSGTFYSPNYPDNYTNSAYCTWYIRPGSGIVRLQFTYVNIENHPSCSFDAISVYDGSSSSSRLLGKLCGSNRATFYSTGPYMTVRFTSDGSVVASGFRAHYRVVAEGGSCRYNCGYQVGNCSCSSSCEYRGNCCQDYEDYCNQTTTSPPLVTTDQPSCRYNCGSDMGSCSCSSSCQYYGNCCYDYNYYCPTTTAPTLTSAGAPCGGYLYSSSGTFYSPNYPDNYTNSAYCTWYIRPGSGIVRLQFTYVNIENHPSCSFDAISVYDGSSSSSRLLGKLCGSNRATFYSTGPYMTVRFTSDGSVVASGFRAHYRVVAEGGSCRYNCGYQVGNCSCSSSCEYRGNCCQDYEDYCNQTTTSPPLVTTDQPSCRYNCGSDMGSCSCSSSCQYYGNCCYDYNYYCPTTTAPTLTSAGAPCGGYLYSSSGTFYSPNYPDNYTNSAYCTWYIRPGSGIVRLQFTYVNIENHPSCSFDAISVYDGSSSSSRLLGKLCGSNRATFYSTGPYMTVRFTSDGSVVASGFRAHYRVVAEGGSCRYNCGYQVGNCSCSSSCEYRGNCCQDYEDYCNQTTTSPPLVTTDQPSCRYNCGSDMGSCSCSSSCQYYGNCCYDYNYYCPTTTAPTLTSAGAPCGGYLYSSSGTFYSPNYPDNYTNSAYCTWYIRPGSGIVRLQFTYVNIENHPSCSFDAISVYDGSSSSSRLLGKLCGSNRATFYSTGPYMTVRFTSDGSVVASGFRAHYRVVAEGGSCRYNCGYQVGNCSCSSSCEYRGNCCQDYEDYCNQTTTSPPLVTTDQPSCRYNCGSDMGSCSCSSSCQYYGNCCYDYNYYCPTTTAPTLTSAGAPCGGYLYSSSGTFYSPNYPDNYTNSAYCTWYIRPGSGIVRLQFTYVNIENHPSCSFDAISVYDGSSSSSRLLGKLCGSNRATFYSTGPYMTVRFTSDGSVVASGFRAHYRVVAEGGSCRYNCGYQVGNCSCSSSCEYRGNCCQDYEDYCNQTTTSPPLVTTDQPSCRYNCGSDMGSCSCSSSCQYYGNCCYDYNYYCPTTTAPTLTSAGAPCGGYLYSSSGTFYSPNYPDNYTNSAYCTWYIRPGSGIVRLQFTYVNIENHPSCSFDAISVYDGSSSSSRLLGKLCGSNRATFYSTGPYMTVRFTSDGSVVASGFRAHYRVVAEGGSCRYNCGYQVGNCSCSSSCEYRGNCCQDYEAYCYYTTEQPTSAQPSCRYNCGRHLGSCSCSSSCRYNGNCCYDYYSYCHNTTLPPTTAQPSCRYNCGRHLGSCSCSSSCRYNGNCCYDYYSYCYYTTPRPTTAQPSCRYNCGRHLGNCSCSSSCQYYGNCCNDYYSYCYYTSPPTTASPCGGHLFGSGTFSSPNYPSYYENNAYCVWQLRAESNQRIFLAFTDMELESCCSCDNIKVYDGSYVGSRYMGTVCSRNMTSFYSTYNYMTVVFQTDRSGVARGFRADFTNSLSPSSGRVNCSSNIMTITIGRSYLNSLGYDGNNLYLNDPQCRPQISSSQVVFTYPTYDCGNVRKFVNGRVVYTNTLRAYKSNYGEIIRQAHFKLNVGCRMDEDSVSKIMYLVQHRDNSTIIGTGRFQTRMDFYTDSSFYYKVTQLPYEVHLNQPLYIQVELVDRDYTLDVFIDTCVASPSSTDFHTTTWTLVRDGCRVDDTYQSYVTGIRPYARFTFKAFEFLRAAEVVFIKCKVLICPDSDNNSRCRRGCNRRVARDLGSEHESQTLVMGPIQLKDPEKKEKEAPEQDKA